jgi:hypothetical protein
MPLLALAMAQGTVGTVECLSDSTSIQKYSHLRVYAAKLGDKPVYLKECIFPIGTGFFK